MAMPTRTLTREEYQALYPPPAPPTGDELKAVRRLLDIAQSDTDQARRCANFLLAWWNAGSSGGFDLTDLWSVDAAITGDMVAVFGLVARVRMYPASFDPTLDAPFRALVRAQRDWREVDREPVSGPGSL